MRADASTVLALAALVAGSAAAAQKPPKPEKYDQYKDPFTDNDPELMGALGYERIGRMLWAEDINSDMIQDVLGEERVIFIETAHFKLASTLRSFPWPKERERREELSAELAALAKVVPKIKTRVRSVGPWLRAHLFAQRLEKTYADFLAEMGLERDEFPKAKGTPRGPGYMGEGPYLGQSEKFTVLLCHKATSIGVYTRNFHGRAASDTTRHNYVNSGSLFFGTAAEFAEKSLMDDRRMHCHVVYGVVHNLLDGYRYYWHSLPAWFSEGVAQWFARRIDDEFRNFAGEDDAGATAFRGHEWPRRVRARVSHEVYPRAAKLMAVMKPEDLKFTDVMMAWSRADYLLGLEPEKMGSFLRAMKQPFEGTAPPTDEQVLARQAPALQAAFGLDAEGFDSAWAAFVLEHYPKK